jgi:hypothetical protein
MAGHLMSPEQGAKLIATALDTAPIDEFPPQIKPTMNPLSQADLDRLRSYAGRLTAGQPLNAPETRDFYQLTDTITREYPGNERSWLLFLVGGILTRALMASDRN